MRELRVEDALLYLDQVSATMWGEHVLAVAYRSITSPETQQLVPVSLNPDTSNFYPTHVHAAFGRPGLCTFFSVYFCVRWSRLWSSSLTSLLSRMMMSLGIFSGEVEIARPFPVAEAIIDVLRSRREVLPLWKLNDAHDMRCHISHGLAKPVE